MAYTNDWNKIVQDEKVLSTYLKSGRNKDSYDISMRLFNSPFCLLESVDPSINSKVQLGRKYMECIASNASTVYLIPGTADFMADAPKKMRDAMSAALKQDAPDSIVNEIIDTMNKKDGVKYFDFRPMYNEYMKYVNLLCRSMAIYLGIGEKKGPNGDKYSKYNWHNFKDDYRAGLKKQSIQFKGDSFFEKEAASNMIEEMFSDWQYIKFYADVGQSSSDSFSNSTTESKIAGMVSSGSDIAKEVHFLKDFMDSKVFSDVMGTATKQVQEIVSKFNGSVTGKRLGDMATSMINGNSVLFPELYGSSDYSPSYSLKFNLMSPYGDTESVYLNVWVPFFHLLALACPRQVKDNANSFSSPFLVKAFSRGWFATNMAIVDGMSVEKGDEWNVNGLPTNLQVTISLKDLYSDLMISKTTEPGSFFSNQSLMDYLAVSAGIDISKPQMLKQLDLIWETLTGSVTQIPDLIYEDMVQSVRNITDKLWKALT